MINLFDIDEQQIILSGTGETEEDDEVTPLEYPAGWKMTELDGTVRVFDALGFLQYTENRKGHRTTYVYSSDYELRRIETASGKQFDVTINEEYLITEIGLPNGGIIAYEYDADRNLTGVTNSEGGMRRYEYDDKHHMTAWYDENGSRIVRNEYDDKGRVTSQDDRMRNIKVVYENGDTCITTYEEDGRIASRTDELGMVTRYTYDLLGRISRTYSDAGMEIRYRYDCLDRLAQIRYGNGVVTCYHYDGAENRVRKESLEGAIYYVYNEKNQLICEEGIRGRTVFSYSRQGSILSEEGSDGIREFAYNSKNQQVKVKCQNGQIQENRYDAEGLRHEMKENEKLLRFVYHRGELLYEGGKDEKSYHLGYGIEAVSGGGEISYYHRDEQLSMALITGEAGDVRNHYQYDAFGVLLEAGEKAGNQIRYTVQQYDGVAEQYYLRARYYNPKLGRFMQEDLYLGDGLNLYAYCHNNPVMYYDPSGYDSQKVLAATIPGMTYDQKVEALYQRRDEYVQGKIDGGTFKFSDKGLLTGELDAVLYNVMQTPWDDITPHHMPLAQSITNNEQMNSIYEEKMLTLTL